MLWCSQSSVGKGMTPVRLFFRIRSPSTLLPLPPPPLCYATHVNTRERERERRISLRSFFFGFLLFIKRIHCLVRQRISPYPSHWTKTASFAANNGYNSVCKKKDPLFNWNICISHPLILFKKKKEKFVFFIPLFIT